jgi:hypothetical protein
MMRRLLVVVILGIVILPLGADVPKPQKRLEAIIAKMKEMRFCKSRGCIYRNITFTLTPNQKKKGSYEALVKADIERLSGTYDSGDYRFTYNDPVGWQLMGGVESTDVNETVYRQDQYQSRSIYGRNESVGAVSTLPTPTGYQQLYLQVLNQGRERR